VYTAVSSCAANAPDCYCPPLITSAEGCSACLGTIVPTYAAGLVAQAMACSTECLIQCDNVYTALASCPTNAPLCACPTVLESGSACSACLVPFLPTRATVVGTLLKACSNYESGLTNPTSSPITAAQPSLSPITATQPISSPTQAGQLTLTTLTVSPASTSVTHSGARSGFERLVRENYIAIVMVIVFVASFLSFYT
jgi:hypothetical protein